MSDNIGIWEAQETGLIICPGLAWAEWYENWQALDQTQRSINWWVGDALCYAVDAYGEQWSQAVDPKYAEQNRGALRVARLIPKELRRKYLSWSCHRECASAETIEERVELLDLAEANQWGAREISAELRKRREGRRPGSNMGPPISEEISQNPSVSAGNDGGFAEKEIGSTWNEPVALLTYQPSVEQILADIPPDVCGRITFSDVVAGDRYYTVSLRTPGGKLIGTGRGPSLSRAISQALRPAPVTVRYRTT